MKNLLHSGLMAATLTAAVSTSAMNVSNREVQSEETHISQLQMRRPRAKDVQKERAERQTWRDQKQIKRKRDRRRDGTDFDVTEEGVVLDVRS